MNEFIWALIARLVSSRLGFALILKRALLNAYKGVRLPDIISGGETYMRRFWIFNPYPASNQKFWWGRWLPSIRLHHILLPDADRHLHDHPWAFRTIVLDGYYVEEKADGFYRRTAGETAGMKPEEFHRIRNISYYGAWTLFFTWKYQEPWGFQVDGKKIPSREYLANKELHNAIYTEAESPIQSR
jgi:hypothetical protein